MKRLTTLLAGAALLGIIVTLTSLGLRTNDAADSIGEDIGAPPPSSISPQIGETASAAADAEAHSPAPADAEEPQPPTEENIERWIADTKSPDARARARAIVALAEAPKAKAIPALKEVLDVGEPQLDRQIALRSLHTLALRQGDDDGRIRDVMRGVVYHGDDDGASESAQALLEDIEAAFAQ